ncbi:MAG TPA: hypothetical protein VG944_03240 [Fimbriimonas sp.]|nr:hypothetical protein [Fimbriimonas sp.]
MASVQTRPQTAPLPDQPNSPQPAKARTAAWWVKVLVLWHVFCITVWSCPKPNDALVSGKVTPPPFAIGDWLRLFDEKDLRTLQPVTFYLFTTGTWQYWDMFAPNPANIDWWGDAVVTFKDGTSKTYQYPRMFLLPIPEKYLRERFRKFYERAHDDTYSYLFPVFAMRVALLNDTDPNNPPVKVGLRRHWKQVADPGEKEFDRYDSYQYFTYEVDPKLLDRLKKEGL